MSDSTSSTRQLHGNLGVASICFMVIAAAAPLTVVGGPMILGFAVGNGAGLPMMYVFTALVLLAFAFGFSAMTPHVKSAGAFYSYIHLGLGARAGVSAGYTALISYLSLYAGVYALFGTAARSLSESFDGPSFPWWLWALFGLLAISFLGYRNIELSGRILSVLLVAEVAVVLVLDAVVVARGGDHGLSTGFLQPDVVLEGGVGNALIFAVLSFIGIEATAVFRSEARDPDRTVTRALFISLTIVGSFYALASWALVSAVGDGTIQTAAAADPEGVLPVVSQRYLGTVGHDLIAVLFVTSIFAAGVTFHNVVARYVFTLANRSLAPAALARSHPQHGSPYRASMATSIVTGVLVLGALVIGLEPILDFYTWTAGLASLGYIGLLAATCAAVIWYFRKHSHEVSLMRGLVVPGIGLAGLLLILILMFVNLGLLVGDNTTVEVAIIAALAVGLLSGPILAVVAPDRFRMADVTDPISPGEPVGADPVDPVEPAEPIT